MLDSLFNKVKGLKTCKFIKKRLQHRCFPVKSAKILRQLLLRNISGGCFLDSKKLIPDPLVTGKLIPKGTLKLLYTNIAQLMAHTTVVYVATYLAIMLADLLAFCRGKLRAKGQHISSEVQLNIVKLETSESMLHEIN